MNRYYLLPEESRDEFMNLQIDSWRSRIALLNAIKPIVKAYDGKTYSKRFDKAIEDKYNTKEDRNNYIYVSHSYGDRLYICIHCYRSLSVQREHYTDSYQVNDQESAPCLATYTPEGSKLRRIDAAKTLEYIDVRIAELHEKIDKTLRAWANIGAYNAKIEQVRQLLHEAADLIGGAPSEFTGLYKTEYILKESRY